jgi:hypothetical protein
MDAAISRRAIPFIRYLARKSVLSETSTSLAVRTGELEIIQLLYENGMVTNPENALNEAVQYGHRHIMDYLCDKGVLPSTTTMVYAVLTNDKDVVQYLYNKNPVIDERAIYSVANDHHHPDNIEMVRYLYKELSAPFDKSAKKAALFQGHMKIYKYLKSKRWFL